MAVIGIYDLKNLINKRNEIINLLNKTSEFNIIKKRKYTKMIGDIDRFIEKDLKLLNKPFILPGNLKKVYLFWELMTEKPFRISGVRGQYITSNFFQNQHVIHIQNMQSYKPLYEESNLYDGDRERKQIFDVLTNDVIPQKSLNVESYIDFYVNVIEKWFLTNNEKEKVKNDIIKINKVDFKYINN